MQLLAVAATASLAEVSPPKVEASYCRRGTYPAPIHSLAFSPASVQPPLLCAASGHGTVHLFRLDDNPDRCDLRYLGCAAEGVTLHSLNRRNLLVGT